MESPEFIVLGQIVRAHGVRGAVKVLPLGDWERLGGRRALWVGPPGGSYRRVDVEQVQVQPRAVVLQLAGVTTPEAAAVLTGSEVAIPRADAPDPPEGSFYHYDVLGLEVVAGERALGRVREILETPAHDVYVVDGAAGEWMLPVTRAHVARIDVQAGRIELSADADVAGLLQGGEGEP